MTRVVATLTVLMTMCCCAAETQQADEPEPTADSVAPDVIEVDAGNSAAGAVAVDAGAPDDNAPFIRHDAAVEPLPAEVDAGAAGAASEPAAGSGGAGGASGAAAGAGAAGAAGGTAGAPAAGSGGSGGSGGAPVPEARFCRISAGQRFAGQLLGCDSYTRTGFPFFSIRWDVDAHTTAGCSGWPAHVCTTGSECRALDSRDGQPDQIGVCE